MKANEFVSAGAAEADPKHLSDDEIKKAVVELQRYAQLRQAAHEIMAREAAEAVQMVSERLKALSDEIYRRRGS